MTTTFDSTKKKNTQKKQKKNEADLSLLPPQTQTATISSITHPLQTLSIVQKSPARQVTTHDDADPGQQTRDIGVVHGPPPGALPCDHALP